MLKLHDPTDETPNPACRATVDRIQAILDGETPVQSLAGEPHLAACAACRERVRGMHAILAVLATPAEPVAQSPDFTERVVRAVWDDRHANTRRRVYRTAAWLALAACVFLAVFAIVAPKNGQPVLPLPVQPDFARDTNIAPPPREKTPPAPRPVRFGDEFAKAGQVLREAPKPLTDTVAVAPKLIDMFAGALTNPGAEPNPMGNVLEPAKKTLAELPSAARTGLEPVTDTAQKAFGRLLRDVSAMKPKPNS
jgi:hypothetical protein